MLGGDGDKARTRLRKRMKIREGMGYFNKLPASPYTSNKLVDMILCDKRNSILHNDVWSTNMIIWCQKSPDQIEACGTECEIMRVFGKRSVRIKAFLQKIVNGLIESSFPTTTG